MIWIYLIKAWASTQTVVALSSAEAELYALVKASAQALGMRSLIDDFGESKDVEVKTDSSAALGICSRRGGLKPSMMQVAYLSRCAKRKH